MFQSSNFAAEIYDGNIDNLHKNCVVQIISGRTTGTFPNVNYTGSFLSVVNNGPNFTSQRIDIITNKNTASYKRSWYYGNDTDYPGWSPWILDISNTDLMIFGGAKSVAIATETNIVHMYFYTDVDKQNGYRIDVNGTTKRLSLLRITNGSSAEICGVGMS